MLRIVALCEIGTRALLVGVADEDDAADQRGRWIWLTMSKKRSSAVRMAVTMRGISQPSSAKTELTRSRATGFHVGN